MSALLAALLLAGCTTAPPSNPGNLCEVFRQQGGWQRDAERAADRWGVPVPILMAFLYQESRFVADARPPRRKILWVIPGPRPSDAYGYPQALDGTWNDYRHDTGNRGADRDDFGDAVDFVGWYNDQSWRRNRIPKNDAYHLYLAYHEGQGGFAKGTWRRKAWLQEVARKVARRAAIYSSQLVQCPS